MIIITMLINLKMVQGEDCSKERRTEPYGGKHLDI